MTYNSGDGPDCCEWHSCFVVYGGQLGWHVGWCLGLVLRIAHNSRNPGTLQAHGVGSPAVRHFHNPLTLPSKNEFQWTTPFNATDGFSLSLSFFQASFFLLVV